MDGSKTRILGNYEFRLRSAFIDPEKVTLSSDMVGIPVMYIA